ncbi:MAG TPA: hypothetical protein VH593_20815 [Ktedonobacteraceae bacterium]|jgi:hypothetical protein
MDLRPLPQTADLPILVFQPAWMQDTRERCREIIRKAVGTRLARSLDEREPPALQCGISTLHWSAGGLIFRIYARAHGKLLASASALLLAPPLNALADASLLLVPTCPPEPARGIE